MHAGKIRRLTATHHGSVCEELDIVALANISHPVQGPGVNQRELRGDTTIILAALLEGELGARKRQHLHLIGYNRAGSQLSAYLVCPDCIKIA